MILSRLIALLIIIAVNTSAFGQAIPSFITVERIGTGSGALSSAAQAVFLDTYLPTTAGQASPTGTVSFPTTVNGSQLRLTDTGSGSSAGYFTRYVNGQGYAVPGYDAALGTATVASSSPATVNRVIGTVSSTFAVDTQTGFNNGGSSNFRSVASVDGTAFWGAGSNSGGLDGITYISSAGSVQSMTQIVAANSRHVRIFNNSLFYSTSSATTANNGIFLAGSPGTLPTTASSATQLPGTGFSGSGGIPSATGFYLFDNPLNANNWNGTGLDTMYVADDRSTSNGGGIQRWVFDGTTWNVTGTFFAPARGLVATIDVNSLVTIWFTSTETSANNLRFTQDQLTATGGAFTSATTLATAATNTVFRGVDLDFIVSVPEPSTYALIGMIGFIAVQRYRRRKPEGTPVAA